MVSTHTRVRVGAYRANLDPHWNLIKLDSRRTTGGIFAFEELTIILALVIKPAALTISRPSTWIALKASSLNWPNRASASAL